MIDAAGTCSTIRSTVSAGWSVIGPLVGVVIGALLGFFLSRKAQREQWQRENRLREYREVLSVLAKWYLTLVELPAQLKKQADKLDEAKRDLVGILSDRIFTVDELDSAQIMNDWVEAVDGLCEDQEVPKFGKRFNAIRHKVIDLAKQL